MAGTEPVTAYWLRTTTLDDESAGPAGTLDLVVVTGRVLAHLQFLAMPREGRWSLATRTRTWPLAEIGAVSTETLPSGPGGQDGLLVEVSHAGAGLELEWAPADPAPGGAGGLGNAVPAKMRIVVEPAEREDPEPDRRRQRVELALLVAVAAAVHRGLALA